VTIVTPLLFAELARREGGRPSLDPRPLEALQGRAGDVTWLLDAYQLGRFLRPARFRSNEAGRTVGVPMLDRDEFDAFASNTDADPGDPTQGDRWWEFWETEDGRVTLFPADRSDDLAVAVTLSIPTRRGVQLRPLYLGLVVEPTGDAREDPPSVPESECEFDAEVDDDGVPYAGSCNAVTCPHACRPVVKEHPDLGIVLVVRCKC
jgi:hypothetical protein